MLSRLSVIENSENLRVENESNRIEVEKIRKETGIKHFGEFEPKNNERKETGK